MVRRATAERGEHELVLAGKTYVLRPSVTALSNIEKQTGKATLALVRLGGIGELSLEQLGIVGSELIRAGADPTDEFTKAVDPERIAELIFEEGLPAAQSRLTLCLMDAASGGRTATGEAKAAPTGKK